MIPLPLTSKLPGVVWPAMPGGKGSQLLALLFQLDESQWLPAAEIERRQFGQLRQLVQHCYRQVPFYRDRMRAAGIEPTSAFEPEDWRRMPLLTRHEVQQAGNRLKPGQVPREHGGQSEWFTSGSTGQPIRVVGTALTGLVWNALTLRDHRWHERDFSGKLAAIRWLPPQRARPPKGERSESWGSATLDVVETGPSVSLNLQSSPAEQAAWLLAEDPDYLLTYPSALRALIGELGPRAGRLPRLRQVRTIGESCSDETRRLCQDQWGVPVVDLYSTQEGGNVALQCPQVPRNYHVQSEAVLVEVLDPDGQPTPPGGLGRVVLTPLHNFAGPLLRYEVGDWAEPGQPCGCGRGLPVLRRVVGRQRNLAISPDGGRHRPSIVLSGIDDLTARSPIRQFQVVQRGLSEVEVLLVADRPLDDTEQRQLAREVDRAFGWTLTVSLSYHQRLPLGPNGKFEDFRCEVPAPPIAPSE